MLQHLREGYGGEHASNLGGLLAHSIASQIPGCRAFIADPVVVDEFHDVARLTGFPEIQRRSIFHALNQKAIAKRYAADCGTPYEKLNLIVVHMGGGISVGAHQKGRVIDVNDALQGDGPMAPERAGALPAMPLVRMCFSGRYTQEELIKKIAGKGGMVALTGTNSFLELTRRMQDGDTGATEVFHAMAYATAKEIGAMAAALGGDRCHSADRRPGLQQTFYRRNHPPNRLPGPLPHLPRRRRNARPGRQCPRRPHRPRHRPGVPDLIRCATVRHGAPRCPIH